jgi:hypothetical protein
VNDQPKDQEKTTRPRRKPAAIRILRMLRRSTRAARSREHRGKRQSAEQVTAHWTRNLGIFTFALVVVGIVAAIVSYSQWRSMRDQLDEMQAEQRPNLWFGSNLGSPQFLETAPGSGQILWTVHLTNYGKAFVAGGTLRKGIKIGNGAFHPSYKEPEAGAAIGPTAPDQEIFVTVVSRPGLAASYYNSALMTNDGIQVKLVADYHDLGSKQFQSSMCLKRTNAGSIAFCPVGNSLK